MTRRSALRVAVINELRSASPAWAAALVGIVASATVAGGEYRGLGVLVYAVGAASIGALMLGHEYVLGTLPTLLTRPASRSWTMAVKLAVLVALLLPLAVVGHLFTFSRYRVGDIELTVIFWLPLATAVGLAPWLTMLCRSATAGMAFSLAMPGVMFTFALIIWVARHGWLTPAPQEFIFRFSWFATLTLSAIGLIAGWRSFQRLEVVEGQGTGLPLPYEQSAARRRERRHTHPVLLLVRKELRLQRMTLLIAAAYGLFWVVLVSMRHVLPDDVPSVMTLLYICFLPFMPGSLGSAEERQLGTIEWQSLMPLAAWKQWLVKVVVVVGVAGMLGVGLPALLTAIPDRVSVVALVVAVLLLSAGGLYVSSAFDTSLWALLTSIGAMVAAVLLASRAVATLSPQAILLPAFGLRLWTGLAVAAAVLTLAMLNHNRPHVGSSLGLRHVAAAAGCLACAIVALTLMV